MGNSHIKISDLDTLETLSMDKQTPLAGGWSWSGWLRVTKVEPESHKPAEKEKEKHSWTVQWRVDPKPKHDDSWREGTVTYTSSDKEDCYSVWWGW